MKDVTQYPVILVAGFRTVWIPLIRVAPVEHMKHGLRSS